MADIELNAALPQVGGARTITLNVTTGAAPVDVPLQDPSVWRVIVNVTTGGTAGEELLNLVWPALDSNAGNNAHNSQKVFVYLQTRSDPADKVRLTQGDEGREWFTFSPTGNDGFMQMPRVYNPTLSYEGASIASVWSYYSWNVAPNLTGWNFGFKTDSGAQLIFRPIESVITDGDGVSVTMKGGSGNGAGVGGNLTIGPAAGGNLYLEDLPTSDPMVVDAAWWNAGVLTKSAAT